MRKLLLPLLLISGIMHEIHGQSCLPGGITFTSQAQIDNFKINYPGCKTIGQIIINGTNITNLDSLDEITTISAGFELINNPALINLNGLKSLDSVGNQFIIAKNNTLTDISGLHNLRSVVELDIWDNQSLPNLNGLENLTYVKDLLSIFSNPALTHINALQQVDSVGALEIRDNMKLASLHGLENLRHVGAAAAVNQTGLTDISVNIESNPLLTSLTGLDNLKTVVGGMAITYNAALSSLLGLGNLTHVGGLKISHTDHLFNLSGLDGLTTIGNKRVALYGGACVLLENWGLVNLNGLGNLKSVAGNILITANRELNSLNGLNQLNYAGGLIIEGNDKLPGLAGLESLTTIDSNLILSGLLFTDLTGLSSLEVVGDFFDISGNPNLVSLSGMNSLSSVSKLSVSSNGKLTNLTGLPPLKSLYSLQTINNPALQDLQGLDSLQIITQSFYCSYNQSITNFTGLGQLTSIGGDMEAFECPNLINFNGLNQLTEVGQNLNVYQNRSLVNLQGLGQLGIVGGYLSISQDSALQNLQGLESLQLVGKEFFITQNPAMSSLSGLAQLRDIGGAEGYPGYIVGNHALLNLTGLEQLSTVSGELNIQDNASLQNLQGLNHLKSVRYNLRIEDNPVLQTLDGLDSLVSVESGGLIIRNNYLLSDLSGLLRLNQIGYMLIQWNTSLSDCAVYPVCNQILNNPSNITIYENALGCNTVAEVQAFCQSKPVTVRIFLDESGTTSPIQNFRVALSGNAQMNLKTTDAAGFVGFAFLENGAFSLDLPQAPENIWQIAEHRVVLNSSTGVDSTHVTFLLTPKVNCPELRASVGLPSFFRGCLVNSEIEAAAENSGDALAESVRIAVVLPPVLELLHSQPPAAGINGDTIFFELGDLRPFESVAARLTVKTRCDTFLLGQTLCIEAYAGYDNPCPVTLPAFSEIKITAQCLADTLVRFTLKNIGDAPTQMPHEYRVIRNDLAGPKIGFNLAAHQHIVVDLPADGATYRMEATKTDDGTLTAKALENCGGLSPGFVTAFWQDQGTPEYATDCREVVGSFDPNQKTAVPIGTGTDHVLPANYPILYTIDFQNTGTDTAFRVLLRDDLDKNLDISTFRPVLASHPYRWEIRDHHLEVLFFPIMLPDSNVNEPASHGFFTFEIEQKPNLPDGTVFENTASIVFDFNPPIITNTVRHTIGHLLVQVDEPTARPALWRVLGNPARDAATFQALEDIPGEKRFDLFDALGRPARTTQFSGQTFEFRRDGLPAGWYVFRISDAQGRVFAGKIVVVE